MTNMARPPFLMIRHGETDWNREKRYQGQVDIPLNALGREQAAGNGRLLRMLGHDWAQWRFYSSPLGRARDTMEILRGELGLDPQDYAVDDRLIEITFGDWERKRLEELEAEEPGEMAKRNANKWVHAPPGGETRVFSDKGARPGDGLRQTHSIAACDQYTEQCDAFAKVVLGEAELPYGIEDAIQMMRIIDALFRAGDSGRWEKP